MTTAQQDADAAAPRDLGTADQAQRAQQWVRDELAKNGTPPSGAAVAREFGMSPKWGQKQLNIVCPDADGRSTRSASARPSGPAGSARRTVGDEVRDRASARADADGPVTVIFGADASAQSSARPPAPPTRTGTPIGTPIGTASARPIGTGEAPIGTASARGSARPSARPAPAPPSGRVVAWAGFLFGSIVSVIANVLHAWIPPAPPQGVDPAKWAAEWAPSFAAQATGAVFPLILLFSVEVISRIKWPPGRGWIAVRYGGGSLPALGSGVISYVHLHGLLVAYGYDPLSAAIGPLAIDGLMIVCGFGLLAISLAARGKAKS